MTPTLVMKIAEVGQEDPLRAWVSCVSNERERPLVMNLRVVKVALLVVQDREASKRSPLGSNIGTQASGGECRFVQGPSFLEVTLLVNDDP